MSAELVLIGNIGNTGNDQKIRGFWRSHLKHKSGNMGTQLCLIGYVPPILFPVKKMREQKNALEAPF